MVPRDANWDVHARRSQGRAWRWRARPAGLLAPRYRRHQGRRRRKLGNISNGNPLGARNQPQSPRCCVAEDEPVCNCSLPVGLRRRRRQSTCSSSRLNDNNHDSSYKSWSTSPRNFARRLRRSVCLNLLAKIHGEVDQLLVG